MEEVLAGFVQDNHQLYGSDLIAVFAYGSVTTGEHVAGRSDINVGVVLSRVTPAALRTASPYLRKWARQGLATPLFLDPEFLRTAVDVFPIEFLDMQSHHRGLWGPDLLTGLQIGRESLRRQCEQELRGKLLRLRQAYVESSRSPKELETVLISAASGLAVLARTLLYLAGAQGGEDTLAVFERVEKEFGISAAHLRKAWQLKRGDIRVTGSEVEILYQEVLEEFQRLVRVVDALPS